MTLLSLVKYLRTSILSDTGGTGTDWVSITEGTPEVHQLRWSNEELTDFINAAEKEATRAAFLLKKSEAALSISSVAGTSEYPVNSKILRIKEAYSQDGRTLSPIEHEDLTCIPDWRNKVGTPTSYVIDSETSTILLYPKPVEAGLVHLLYYRLPLNDLDWGVPTGVPEIREEYQRMMLDYAAHLAYLKEDANAFDPGRAEYFRQKFVSNFTTSSAYGEVRRRRNRAPVIRYRG